MTTGQSFDFVRAHNEAVNRLDYMVPREPINGVLGIPEPADWLDVPAVLDLVDHPLPIDRCGRGARARTGLRQHC